MIEKFVNGIEVVNTRKRRNESYLGISLLTRFMSVDNLLNLSKKFSSSCTHKSAHQTEKAHLVIVNQYELIVQ